VSGGLSRPPTRVLSVLVSSRPPLPPVTRLLEEHASAPTQGPHTMPGWLAGLIYLGLAVVLLWAVAHLV
jgi:hypothetical protein